jgi:bifunctional non-homologous end joining protein LigD
LRRPVIAPSALGLGAETGTSGSPMSSPPPTLRPMFATLGPLPSGDGWSFEPKWDGFRGLCVVDRFVRLLSRRGNDLTRLCPGVSALSDLGPIVLDGEIVAFHDGRQSFEALQGAMRHRTGSEDVVFLAFDLLWLRGQSLLNRQPLRRAQRAP